MVRTYKVQHDLAEKHVLERAECARIVLRAQVLERLVEVRVCGGVVFVFGVEDAGLEVERGLEGGRAVDAVRGCACGGEGGLWVEVG